MGCGGARFFLCVMGLNCIFSMMLSGTAMAMGLFAFSLSKARFQRLGNLGFFYLELDAHF
jgi:hypothetical protein